MSIRPVPLDSPIQSKIAWARECLEAVGEILTNDDSISLLRKDLIAAVRESHEAMVRLGIADECRSCEEAGGGSCCGLGIENYYSGGLILINLLLGVDIPSERLDPRSCFFLGKTGCILAARDVICINYLCDEIASRFPGKEISALREKEGLEIRILFQFHERIFHLLRALGSALFAAGEARM